VKLKMMTAEERSTERKIAATRDPTSLRRIKYNTHTSLTSVHDFYPVVQFHEMGKKDSDMSRIYNVNEFAVKLYKQLGTNAMAHPTSQSRMAQLHHPPHPESSKNNLQTLPVFATVTPST